MSGGSGDLRRASAFFHIDAARCAADRPAVWAAGGKSVCARRKPCCRPPAGAPADALAARPTFSGCHTRREVNRRAHSVVVVELVGV